MSLTTWQLATRIPDRLTVGDNWTWTASSGYDPATWTLSYALVKTGDQIQITTSDNGDGLHLVDVASVTTAAYTAGTYDWQAYITDGTDRHQIARGTVEILPDYDAAGAGLDDRTHVKTTLDALEALIAGKATKDQANMSIGDVSLGRLSPAELTDWHARYKYLYYVELADLKDERGLGADRVEVKL